MTHGRPATERLLGRGRRWWGTLGGGESLYPLFVLFGLNAVDELDRTGFAVLLPNIRDYFGLDTSGILTVVALSSIGALLVAIPIGYYADRMPRVGICIAGALAWSAFSLMTGLATTVVVLCVAAGRIGHRQSRERSRARIVARRLPRHPGPAGCLFRTPSGERDRTIRRTAVRGPSRVLVRLADPVHRVHDSDAGVRRFARST